MVTDLWRKRIAFPDLALSNITVKIPQTHLMRSGKSLLIKYKYFLFVLPCLGIVVCQVFIPKNTASTTFQVFHVGDK